MQRKLTAILAADVVGYSGLMETDEADTLDRLKASRAAIFDPEVAAHGGRLVKLMGDGALVEFTSVVAAVTCARAIQERMADAARATPRGRQIHLRMGVNVGDVIVDGDDIYGDGVNVASRLQALAPAGGVALSSSVRDHVEGKLFCRFEDLGEHTARGFQRPVRVFTLHPDDAGEEKDAPPQRSGRISICVLPFANMSGEPEQEYFSDGISEDIITDLAKVSALLVAPRNTAFTFKGKNVDVAQVARQLHVSHVLEGSVRKAGGRVRITAQLTDAATGGHIWAERYDRDLSDIFALQDEISEAIVTALKLRLLPAEKKAIERRGTDNVEAYNLYLLARRYAWIGGFSGRKGEVVMRMCRRIIDLDPNYPQAWALLANTQTYARGKEGEEENGVASAERALALDPNLAEAHAARAGAYAMAREFEAAQREIDIALRLDPNCHEAHRSAGLMLYPQRRFKESIPHWERAAELLDTDHFSIIMAASAHAAMGDEAAMRRAAERVIETAERVIAQDPDNGSAFGSGAVAMTLLGQAERAKEWGQRAQMFDPDNATVLYNVACGLIRLNETDAGLDLLENVVRKSRKGRFPHMREDPDLESVYDHPRFKTILAAAEAEAP